MRALQGLFLEHTFMNTILQVKQAMVARTEKDFDRIDALIIPHGRIDFGADGRTVWTAWTSRIPLFSPSPTWGRYRPALARQTSGRMSKKKVDSVCWAHGTSLSAAIHWVKRKVVKTGSPVLICLRSPSWMCVVFIRAPPLSDLWDHVVQGDRSFGTKSGPDRGRDGCGCRSGILFFWRLPFILNWSGEDGLYFVNMAPLQVIVYSPYFKKERESVVWINKIYMKTRYRACQYKHMDHV